MFKLPTNKRPEPDGFTTEFYTKQSKNNKSIKKQAKDPNRHFSKEETQLANKQMEKCLTHY